MPEGKLQLTEALAHSVVGSMTRRKGPPRLVAQAEFVTGIIRQ